MAVLSCWLVQSDLLATPNLFALPLMLFVLVSLPTCLVLVGVAWHMRWRKSPRPWQRTVERFLVLTLLVAGILAATIHAIRQPILESRIRGSRIVELLRAYRQRSGAYPTSLELIPEAARLSPALTDWHFEYAPQDNGEFYLAMRPNTDSMKECVWHGTCDRSEDGWCCKLSD
jgi:hypothetical protein